MDRELDEDLFPDTRLGRRLRALLGQLAQAPGQGIALVCQDWVNTKAAYRFLSNERVTEAEILGGHFAATRERIAATRDAPVLMLHDTTEFSVCVRRTHIEGLLTFRDSVHDEHHAHHGERRSHHPGFQTTVLQP